MADKIPLKAYFAGSEASALGEFQPGDAVPVAFGGTGAADVAGAHANLGIGPELWINGSMIVCQRPAAGATLSATGFSIDKMQIGCGGGGQIAWSQATDTNFTRSQKKLALTVAANDASIAATDVYYARVGIEGLSTQGLFWGTAAAKPIAVSFEFQTSVTGTYTLSIRNSPATRSYLTTFTVADTGVHTYFFVIPGDTSGAWPTDNSLGVTATITLGCGSEYISGVANAWQAGNFLAATGSVNWIATNGATCGLTGGSIRAGSVHAPFVIPDFAQELAKCQRYLAGFVSASSITGEGSAWNSSTTNVLAISRLPVTMRIAPTGVVVSNVAHFSFSNGVGLFAASNTEFSGVASQDMALLRLTVTGAPAALTPGYWYFNNTSGYVLFTGAEI